MITKKSISRPFPFLFSAAIIIVLLIESFTAPASAHAADPGLIIIVDTVADIVASDTVCSLREAIANANGNGIVYTDCGSGAGDDLIEFSLGTATIVLTSILPDITDLNGLTIDGGGTIAISGNDAYRVFFVDTGAPLFLNNLTVSDGIDNHNGGGGGVMNHGALTITNSVFSNNNTTLTYGGGAINNDSGTLTIVNSTFGGNAGYFGGAIYNDSGQTATITNSTFHGNHAKIDFGTMYGLGGGIHNKGTLTIRNSTFSGNIADVGGGGIHNQSGGVLNQFNTIYANSTGGDCSNSGTLTGNNNLIMDTGIDACGLTNGVSGNIIGSNPTLGALTGSPAWFPLKAGSPAINKGDNAVCAAPPVNNTSQNKRTRPQGAHCEIGSFEANVSRTFKSIGADDGWILESTETSAVGGALNASATTFNLGDGAADKQYRAVLSFDTSYIPNTAVITRIKLKIKKQGLVGTNPFNILGGLKVDMRAPSFGAAALTPGDFQALAGRTAVATFGAVPVDNWYSAILNGQARNYLNKTGLTQFRLYFAVGDNNDNGADAMKFFSGNHATIGLRPTLIIEYYVP
jgi:CSLREA domain-containing protein